MHFARKQPSEEACSHHLLNLWDIWALLIIIVLFYLAPPCPGSLHSKGDKPSESAFSLPDSSFPSVKWALGIVQTCFTGLHADGT